MNVTTTLVNGVPVHSDKEVTKVEGFQVFYKDGSFANVDTRTSLNKGQGVIQIGGVWQELPKKTVTKRLSVQHPSGTVYLRHLPHFANIALIQHGLEEIVVTVEGKPAEVNALTLTRVLGDTLLSGEEIPESKNVVRGDINIGNISIVAGNVIAKGVTILSQEDREPLQITIMLPPNIDLEIRHVWGQITSGSLDVNLDLSVPGARKMLFGDVRTTHLNLSGTADVGFNSIKGDLHVSLSGSGDLHVHGEVNGKLNLTLSGSGDARINGNIGLDANIHDSGTGDVYVDGVKDVTVVNSGMGDIVIRQMRGRILRRINTGMGDVSIHSAVKN